MADKIKIKISAAIGNSSATIGRGKTIEAAMASAALQAQTDGIQDPEEIKALMLAARRKASRKDG